MTSTLPLALMGKVLSWLPYSSAFWAIRPTLDTWPIVCQSNWPFATQSLIHAYKYKLISPTLDTWPIVFQSNWPLVIQSQIHAYLQVQIHKKKHLLKILLWWLLWTLFSFRRSRWLRGPQCRRSHQEQYSIPHHLEPPIFFSMRYVLFSEYSSCEPALFTNMFFTNQQSKLLRQSPTCPADMRLRLRSTVSKCSFGNSK